MTGFTPGDRSTRYSVLSATCGSTREARRAGIQLAASVTPSNITVTNAYTTPRFAAYVRRVTGESATAADVVQEVFFRMLRSAPRRMDVIARRKYLYRVATNLLRDGARRDRRPWVELGDDVVDPTATADVADETGPEVRAALDVLTPRGRLSVCSGR